MILHYYKALPNFGDALNPWLWPQLLPHHFVPDDDTIFLGIGTIIQASVPRASRYVVLGAGGGYGPFPKIDARWNFHAVRGPLTAQTLGLPAEIAVTDAAYLIRLVKLPPPRPGRAIGFMPHWRSLRRVPWATICDLAGLRFINPYSPVESVLADLAGCDVVIAEAMHGAIVADCLRVPWVPVQLGAHFLDFKWRDWLASIEVSCTTHKLTNMDPLAEHPDKGGGALKVARSALNIAGYYVKSAPLTLQLRQLRRRIESKREAVYLSSDSVIDDRTSTLAQRLEDVRRLIPAPRAVSA